MKCEISSLPKLPVFLGRNKKETQVHGQREKTASGKFFHGSLLLQRVTGRKQEPLGHPRPALAMACTYGKLRPVRAALPLIDTDVVCSRTTCFVLWRVTIFLICWDELILAVETGIRKKMNTLPRSNQQQDKAV